MKVVFCRSCKPGSVLIRMMTMGPWSHVGVIDGDYVIDAAWPKVRITRLSEFKRMYPDNEIAEMRVQNETEALSAARSQIGKPYDFSALLGFVAQRDWQAEDKWFCSELVMWAACKGGFEALSISDKAWIHPNLLWYLARK